MDDDALLVGRVARAHGNKGQVIVNPETDFPDDRFSVGQVMQVAIGGRTEPRTIQAVRFQQGRPIVAFEGIASIDEAEALAGAELKLPASRLPPLPENTFYHHDLIGCDVRDVAAGRVGTVTAVQGPLERSQLVVEGARGEVLVPMVAPICVRIDTAARVIDVDLPEGLLELNARRATE